MKKRGRKELLIDVLEHRVPDRVPFAKLHVAARFIEMYNGRTYAVPKGDIDFTLKVGRDLIKPEKFWFGTNIGM